MERLRGEMGRQRSPPGLDELSDRRGGVAEEPCVWSLLLVWLRNLTAAMLTRGVLTAAPFLPADL